MPMAALRMQANEAELEGAKGKDEAQQQLRARRSRHPTRVRRFFPETLFWLPELITDEAGRPRRLRFRSPTPSPPGGWRPRAVSRNGELGSATSGLRVFQDFFVDIDLPVALTQHDEVSVPVAVYNYLDRAADRPARGRGRRLVRAARRRRSRPSSIGPREVTAVYFRVAAPSGRAATP